MKDDELLAILIAGNKAFQYARENLSDQLEDVIRFNSTHSALKGEEPQSTYCIERQSAL